MPTPEIAESPIEIFRTGRAPVSPGLNGMSIQPPLPRADSALVLNNSLISGKLSDLWCTVELSLERKQFVGTRFL